MMSKMLFTLLDVGRHIGHGVLIVLAANRDLLLHLGHDFVLDGTRLADLTRTEDEDCRKRYSNSEVLHAHLTDQRIHVRPIGVAFPTSSQLGHNGSRSGSIHSRLA